jgi:hypothetical protein
MAAAHSSSGGGGGGGGSARHRMHRLISGVRTANEPKPRTNSQPRSWHTQSERDSSSSEVRACVSGW